MIDLQKINSIENLSKDQLDKILLQRDWEHKYNKKQIRKILRKEFIELFDVDYDSLNQEDKKKINIQLDIMGILSERQSVYFDTCIEMLIEKDNIEQSKQQLADYILELCKKDLLDIESTKGNMKLWANYVVSEETEKRIEELKSLPPMIVKPLPVNQKNNNKGSGYLTIGSDSLILNNNHHTNDIDPIYLDIVNQVSYSLNINLIKNIRNCWRDLFEPETNKNTQEYKEKLQAFETFEEQAIRIMAMLVNQDNQFWFTHKYDKRGRIYSIGYFCNYQGNSYQKACIEFHNKQLITEEIYFF